MILDGCHFQYGDFESREYGVIFAHCDTSSYNQIMGEISSSYAFNGRNKSRYILNDVYSDSPIHFEAEIVSDDFNAFHKHVRRDIEKALFHKPGYRKLYVDIADDFYADTYEYIDGYLKRLYLNCRFVNPSKLEDGNGIVVGYKFTVECDSCMAWQETVEQSYAIAGGNHIISVIPDTNIGDYTYPEVVIYIGSTGGDIIIINMSDDAARFTKFNNLPPHATLTMKGDLNYVSGQNYERFENQNFIRLLDGENKISVTGNVTSIKVKWNNRRFL